MIPNAEDGVDRTGGGCLHEGNKEDASGKIHPSLSYSAAATGVDDVHIVFHAPTSLELGRKLNANEAKLSKPARQNGLDRCVCAYRFKYCPGV